jgi:protein-S-isoprenylcysteine O-methyltransferase Ste14
LAYIAVHIVMTMPAFKRAVFGRSEGYPGERRVYVTVSVVTWVLVYWLHLPVSGFGFVPPTWLAYVGYCVVLLSVVAFFEFATFAGLGSLLGMPGTELSHTAGVETPLMTDGPYASVRQLLFAAMVAASFIGFIPFEEYQLLKSRGAQYRAYMAQTPYRVFRGIW